MSLEAALDEERLEVMALLEGRSLNRRENSSSRPADSAQAPPIRSMLDIDEPQPIRSMLDIDGQPSVRSMLDVGPPPRASSSSARGKDSSSLLSASPIPGSTEPLSRQKSASPRLQSTSPGSGLGSKVDQYRFGMLPSIESQSRPKRVTQGPGLTIPGFSHRRSSSNQSSRTPPSLPALPALPPVATGAAIRALLSPAMKPSTHGTSQRGGRRNNLNTNSFNLMPTPGRYTAESGQVVQMSHAYEKLSDKALASSGSLASLLRRGYNHETGTSVAPDGSFRLERDPSYDGEDEDGDNGDSSSDSDEDRGRAKERPIISMLDEALLPAGAQSATSQSSSSGASSSSSRGRASVGPSSLDPPPQQQKYRSLLDPEDDVSGGSNTLANNTSLNTGKKRVKKQTSPFFETAYVFADPDGGEDGQPDSEAETRLRDLQEAHAMPMQFSEIINTPGSPRCVHQIIRGDYGLMQQQVAHGERRQRMYIVATDLSDEAKYALEWAIGTVVRDGDTLLAVYAMDDPGGGTDDSGAKFVFDLSNVVQSLGGINWREGRSARQPSAPESPVQSQTGSRSGSRSRSRAGSLLGLARAFSSSSLPMNQKPSPLSRSVSRDGQRPRSSLSIDSNAVSMDDDETDDGEGSRDGGASASEPEDRSGAANVDPDDTTSPLSRIPFLELPENIVDASSSTSPLSAEPSATSDAFPSRLQERQKSELHLSASAPEIAPPDFSAQDEHDQGVHKTPPNFDQMSRLEQERWNATAEISRRCAKLLRRTKLQVRVVVEVFHCKSPKRTITDVIDYLEPTLVILGSRGRSSLKGVLLGSFSNYLVTKSSIPVMVVRRRLRKQSGKNDKSSTPKRTPLTRHRNLLGRLVDAKID